MPAIDVQVLHLLCCAYGKGTHETGYKTDGNRLAVTPTMFACDSPLTYSCTHITLPAGHECVTQQDISLADECKSSLLYGEVLPDGVAKMLDADHLDAANATCLVDLGAGTGKLALQGVCQRRVG